MEYPQTHLTQKKKSAGPQLLTELFTGKVYPMDGGRDGGREGWIHRTGSIHTVEYDSAMKRSEAVTQATTWMDLEHRMLSE